MSLPPPTTHGVPIDPNDPEVRRWLIYGDNYVPPPSRAMARWALGLSLIPTCVTAILAVVFASIVLNRSKDGRAHGKGLAKAAFFVVGIWVLLAVAAVAYTGTMGPQRDETGRVTERGRATVVDLRVGDCTPDDPGTGLALTVELVPCTDPHRAEVFGVFDLEGEYTTQDEVGRLSDAGCVDRFRDYVGVPSRRSSLEIMLFYPPNQSAFETDPAVACLAVSKKPLTASVKGSKL